MKKKEIIEIAIYPKLFNVISFYSKGQYSIKISIIQQDQKGNLLYAYPKLIQLRDSKTHQNKKAKSLVQQGNTNYTTQQFYITYNEETIYLNTMATFTLQYEDKKPYKTYIDFKLQLTKFKVYKKSAQRVNNSDKLSNNIQQVKKTTEVDSRRIYINKLKQLNCFKKIIFSDCQYFSYLDTYITFISLGKKFRPNDFTLTQFFSMQTEMKTKFHLENDERKIDLSNQTRGKIIKQISELELKDFYHIYMSNCYGSYCDIRKKFIDLVKLVSNSSILGKSYQNVIDYQININTTLRKKSQLQNYYQTQDQNELFYEIYQQINQLNQYTKHIWQSYLNLLQNIPFKTFAALVKQNFIRQSMLKQTSIVSHILHIQDQTRFNQYRQFFMKRKQVIEDLILCEEDEIYHPFLMVQGYENSNFQQKSNQVNSLVVFIHGYQGSDYDLQKARNYMNLYCPNCYGLLIKSIKDQIQQNIQLLGQKVADQIKAHIAGTLNQYKRINFIGYSLGGIVVRQAVRNLSELKSRMNVFISLASPHLGVTNSDNYLVGTGVWYLANIGKVKNMRQLNWQTTLDSDEIIMKKLANCDSLSWFKKVVLVSSKQDNFVPYYSSRIDEKISNQQIKQMSQSILKRIKKLQRIDVWFDVNHDIGTIDKMLGRRAHIEFLENRIFLDIFFKMYSSHL